MGITNRKERERERRAALILDAAEEVFKTRGFDSATMDEIAARADYSKGTLYLYFRSKDEIWVALVLRAIADMPDRYRAIAAEPGTGLEVLRRLMSAYHGWVQDHPDHFRIGMSWLLLGFSVAPETSNFDEYRRVIGAMYSVVVATIERGKADGSIRSDADARTLAMQLWGASVGLLLVGHSKDEVARRLPGDFDFDKLAPSFVDLLLRGLEPRNEDS